MSPLSTIEQAVSIEATADTNSKEPAYVLSAALLANVLRHADIEDVEMLTNGDEDLYSVFCDRNELGNFVFEHTLETFDHLAHLELQEREMDGKSAMEVEMELRELQGQVA